MTGRDDGAGARLCVTILGCGSSGGVPRLGGPDQRGAWGACDPDNPKNRRRRCALLVERIGPGGATRALIDCGPDIHPQLLAARVSQLDAVLFTHDHADHTHGLDDLRQVVYNIRRKLDAWADDRTAAVLTTRFGYAFETPEGSAYPPILELRQITASHLAGRDAIRIDGAGGPLEAEAFEVIHGGQPALGFRIGPMAYVPDANEIPPAVWERLQGLELFIVDALRYTPHPSHAHLELTLQWIETAAPRRAVLTNMHVDLDYATLEAETPAHVAPAFDGMRIELDL